MIKLIKTLLKAAVAITVIWLMIMVVGVGLYGAVMTGAIGPL